MIVHDCEQRSDVWRALRLGRLTSSAAADMFASRKDGKEAAGRRNLRMRLAIERLTGRSQESEYESDAMRQGREREADAVALYEAQTGTLLRSVGFCQHETLMAGCSPDGVVGDYEGLVEVKSPIAATHWEYLRSGVIPSDYEKQILLQLWITGAGWCDWMSFNPDFPEPLQVKLVRVERDERAIKAFELLAVQFLREVEAELLLILEMAGAAA